MDFVGFGIFFHPWRFFLLDFHRFKILCIFDFKILYGEQSPCLTMSTHFRVKNAQAIKNSLFMSVKKIIKHFAEQKVLVCSC